MRPVKDWYRTPDWDEAARADFEARLGRARGQRSEYLRVKAAALEGAGLLDDAARMYERLLEEHPDRLHESYTHERLGDVARAQGRLDEAERRYRRVLAFQPLKWSSGMTAVSLAEILLDQGRVDDAAEALDQAEESSVTAFHANLFRYLVAVVRVATAHGDGGSAADAAARALDLIDAPDQYSRHPGIGAVRTDDATVAMLKAVAAPT